MKLAVAVLTLALLGAAPAMAQDGTAAPDKGTTATTLSRNPRPGETGQSGVGVETPKIDPKLIIDVFKHLTRPRPRPASPPAPLPVEPATPVVAAPAPLPPVVTTPPPRPVAAAAPAAAAPPIVKPRPSPAAKPPALQAPVAAVAPAVPVEPVIATPAEPAPAVPPPPPVTPVHEAGAAAPVPPLPPQRNASLLSQSPWLLLALLAAAAAIAGATAWSRARQIGRTRAALSLDPRLDLTEGSSSFGKLDLACPPMSIRTRLDFA